MSVTPPSRPTLPWLAWLLAGLALTYVATWWIELYLYVIAIMVGTPAFAIATFVAIIARATRRVRPLLSRAELGVIGASAVIHLGAWAMLRTVSWG